MSWKLKIIFIIRFIIIPIFLVKYTLNYFLIFALVKTQFTYINISQPILKKYFKKMCSSSLKT